MLVSNLDSTINSRFVNKYKRYLQKWCDRLEANDFTIIAISRKGPRLLELLVREGLLSAEVLNRVVTEHSLPLYNFSDGEKIFLIDDSIQFGSTFNRIKSLIEAEAVLQGAKVEIIGLPFASNNSVPEKYKRVIKEEFYNLTKEEINPFINSQISSFRLLGKPYDIDYPILYIKGEFLDDAILECALKDFTSKIELAFANDLELIPSELQVALSNDYFVQKGWTILLTSCNDRNHSGPEFSKFRFFLNPERDTISVVSMNPTLLSNAIFDNLTLHLPVEYAKLWELFVEGIFADKKREGDLLYETNRSKAVFVNYLISFLKLHSVYSDLKVSLNNCYENLFFEGISKIDLQYLIGSTLSNLIFPKLNTLLDCSKDFEFRKPIDNNNLFELIREEIYPSDYVISYNKFLTEKINLCTNPEEIITYVFYAQHREIEMKSRIEEPDVSADRLKFGVTLKYLHDKVLAKISDANNFSIHQTVDNLIDSGSIVPKYADVSKAGVGFEIWGRIFRIGEESAPKRIQTLIFLFETLSKKLGLAEIPAVLLEKFSVLASTNDFDFKELIPLAEMNIRKGYSLYGARSELNFSLGSKFYLDFGVEHKILTQSKSTDGYSLGEEVRDVYPLNELHLEKDARRKIEDIAEFCKMVHFDADLKNKALITVTTLASDDEYFQAVSAELELWLSHKTNNIYNCISILFSILRKCDEIEELKSKGEAYSKLDEIRESLFEDLNSKLSESANYTAQVALKAELFKNRDTTYDTIRQAVAKNSNTVVDRVWEDLDSNLNGQKRQSKKLSSGTEEILSALRIARATTSVLRNMLSLSGYKHPHYPYKPNSLKESLERLKNYTGNLVTDGGKKILSDIAFHFFNNGDQNHPSLHRALDSLVSLVNEKTTFSDVLKELRPILFEIINACASIYETYGPVKVQEESRLLAPPKYLLMWDIRKSTEVENRSAELEPFILEVNKRIKNTLGDKIYDFKVETTDDGNGFICEDFRIVLIAFNILYQSAVNAHLVFRAGCDVNFQGDLRLYERRKILAGRAYEFAARITTFFKEYKGRWTGAEIPEPSKGYLIVGELARRTAESNGEWSIPENFSLVEPDGLYEPRVRRSSSFPFKINIFVGP